MDLEKLQDEHRNLVLLRRPRLQQPKHGYKFKKSASQSENGQQCSSFRKSASENSVCLSRDNSSMELNSAKLNVLVWRSELKCRPFAIRREYGAEERYEENPIVLQQIAIKGTRSFPSRVTKHGSLVKKREEKVQQETCPPNQFTFKDFIVKLSEIKDVPVATVEKVMLSRYNYQRLQKILLDKCRPKCDKLHTQELHLPDDVPCFAHRIPQKQLLIEMTAVIKEQIGKFSCGGLKSAIQKVPPYHPSLPLDSAPLAEIVLYQSHGLSEKELLLQQLRDSEVPGKGTFILTAASKYFQGAMRSASPFDLSSDDMISPSEVAVLDSLMNGGIALNLKAHFVSILPDIKLMAETLVYLNLSFNCFEEIPIEIFDLHKLTALKLRNNPLYKLPDGFSALDNLKTLVISFCSFTEFPEQLFALKGLEFLDISYNNISCIPSGISSLQKLHTLDVAGNRLYSLPASMLKMHNLVSLETANTFMHPVFWSELTPEMLSQINEPCDEQQSGNAEPDIQLKQRWICDFCGEKVADTAGFRTVRPVKRIFGVINLPILFSCCSEECLDKLLKAEVNLIR